MVKIVVIIFLWIKDSVSDPDAYHKAVQKSQQMPRP